MIIEEIFSIVVCIWAITLGSYILYIDRGPAINKVFIGFMFAFSAMTFLDVLQHPITSSTVALIIAKTKYGFMAIIATLFLHFSILIGDFEFTPNTKLKLLLMYIPSIILFALMFTPYIVADVDSSLDTVPGHYYLLLLVYIFVAVAFGLVVQVSSYFKARDSIKKKQLQMIFTGMGITAIATFIFFGILHLPGSVIFTVPMFFFFAYAIVKYKLLKIPQLVQEPDITSEPIEYEIEPGFTYIIPEHEPKLGFQLFAKTLKEGAHGICITMRNPDFIRKKYGLRKTPIVTITNRKYDELSVRPEEIASIRNLLRPYFQDPEKSVIFLIDDKTITSNVNTEDHSKILELSKTVFDTIEKSNSRFIISVSPRSISPKKRMPIIKTKAPLLEFTRLTAFIFEEICNNILQFLIRNGYLKTEKIPAHFSNLSKKDPFFKNVSYRASLNPITTNSEIRLTNILEAQRLSKQIFIDKIKLFLSEFENIDTATNLNSIVMNSITKYGLSKNEFQLHLGDSYIIPEEEPHKSYEIFSEFTSKDYKGLCITKSNPKKIKRKYALSKRGIKTYWLTELSESSQDILPPKLEHILSAIEEFLAKGHDKKIVILDGVEYLISFSGDNFDSVLGFLRQTTDRISESNALILIPLNMKILSEERIGYLTRSGMELYKPF